MDYNEQRRKVAALEAEVEELKAAEAKRLAAEAAKQESE